MGGLAVLGGGVGVISNQFSVISRRGTPIRESRSQSKRPSRKTVRGADNAPWKAAATGLLD
jgi:hypothetical protein